MHFSRLAFVFSALSAFASAEDYVNSFSNETLITETWYYSKSTVYRAEISEEKCLGNAGGKIQAQVDGGAACDCSVTDNNLLTCECPDGSGATSTGSLAWSSVVSTVGPTVFACGTETVTATSYSSIKASACTLRTKTTTA